MPRTGGVYAPPAGTKGVSNTTIQSVPYNAFVDDLTADANAARPITAGGTGATSASAARAALGIEIGVNVQAYDADLTAIAALVSAADKLPYATGTGAWALTTFTSFGRSLVDDADASTALSTLGVTTFAKTLLDDASNSVARTTLDVYSKSEVDGLTSNSTPAGTVIFYAKNTAPSGYLKANGAAVSRTTYAALFTAIGTTFGAGDGSTTFNLPDLRGEFVRGWDDARGIDTGRVFGSAQGANIQSHTHAIDPPSTTTSSDTHTHTFSATTSSNGSHTHGVSPGNFVTEAAGGTSGGVGDSGSEAAATDAAGDHTHTVSGTTGSDTHTHTVDIASFTSGAAGSGTDTRPRNIALLACIKY
ncbi:phage tail protein [Sinorhizobium sp. 7-81]|uniref:phage tail protein n=1 Tax=Sinorhizobium sp. 8-89 TaxID=3049089 RepID=UPI0024C3FB55|nr:phage tail protein [Sinorhizobium sp. 8-89]MDK1493365.1 phage tail protein [Sinorhizobium sp. 8-89]